MSILSGALSDLKKAFAALHVFGTKSRLDAFEKGVGLQAPVLLN